MTTLPNIFPHKHFPYICPFHHLNCWCSCYLGVLVLVAPLPLHLQLGAYLNDACVGDGAGPLIGTLLSHLQRVPSQGALVTMGCDADVQLMQGDEFLTVVNLNAWAGSGEGGHET